MIATILKTRSKADGIIAYNEAKCRRGEALLVGYYNIPSDFVPEILDTFERLEENAGLNPKFTQKTFHMTVGPSEGEAEIGHDKGEEICRRIMEEMGYGGQPVLIYRHNDIDREHYHIVSSRIQPNGKMMPCSHERRRLMKVLEKLGPEYGFVKGLAEEKKVKEKKKGKKKPTVRIINPNRAGLPRFNTSAKDVMRSLGSLFLRALQYDIHSMEQMQAVMGSMRVRLTARKTAAGKETLVLRGLDKNGKEATKPFSVRKLIGMDGLKMLRDRIIENRNKRDVNTVSKIAIGTKSAWSMKAARSAEQYKDLMEQFGIFTLLLRNKKSKKKELEEVILVDPLTDTILDTSWLDEIRLEDFRRAEEDRERWGKKDKSKAVLSGKDKKEVETVAAERQEEYLAQKKEENKQIESYEQITLNFD